ncbi:hypothetical protein AZ66_15675 [Paenibacillus sp. E194]|uniref:hypothetical protein n=1 Tax=Paenibacillus sp. E194 TaxID=1458845 RepID=UPI0005C9447E|nr:hypothetical protein [Paenibacillus sp. E194]KJB86988.1 hypothetical protein AZ66_15675 [Paenibacillus sp. E194]
MKKFILFSFFASMVLVNTAFASGTSSASIGIYDTYAKGQITPMDGTVKVSGSNAKTSTNELWIELYRDDGTFWSYDSRVSGSQAAVGGSVNFSSSVKSDKYYIWLDPDGPDYKGCSGSGKAVN